MDYNIFNSYVWKTKLHYDGKENLIKKIEEKYHEQPNLTPKKWKCNVHSSYEDKNNNDFFLLGENNLLDVIENKIYKFLSLYGKKINLHGDFVLSEIWYNVYKNNQFQEPHIHGESIFSGCYYLKFNKHAHHQTHFYNPNYNLDYSKLENNPHFCFEPDCEEDDLIIFPSALKHGTKGIMHNSNDTRITISFNVSMEKYYIKKENNISYQ